MRPTTSVVNRASRGRPVVQSVFPHEAVRDSASGVSLIPPLHENFKRRRLKNNEFRSMAINPWALLPDSNFIITIFCIIIRATSTEGKWNFFMADSMAFGFKVNILSFAIIRSFAVFLTKPLLARGFLFVVSRQCLIVYLLFSRRKEKLIADQKNLILKKNTTMVPQSVISKDRIYQ